MRVFLVSEEVAGVGRMEAATAASESEESEEESEEEVLYRSSLAGNYGRKEQD